jgi:hypothetical protein
VAARDEERRADDEVHDAVRRPGGKLHTVGHREPVSGRIERDGHRVLDATFDRRARHQARNREDCRCQDDDRRAPTW